MPGANSRLTTVKEYTVPRPLTASAARSRLRHFGHDACGGCTKVRHSGQRRMRSSWARRPAQNGALSMSATGTGPVQGPDGGASRVVPSGDGTGDLQADEVVPAETGLEEDLVGVGAVAGGGAERGGPSVDLGRGVDQRQ